MKEKEDNDTKEELSDMNLVMRKNFQGLVRDLTENRGMDLRETPALFKWTYPDDPNIVYQLLIRELSETEQAQEEREEKVEEDSLIVH